MRLSSFRVHDKRTYLRNKFVWRQLGVAFFGAATSVAALFVCAEKNNQKKGKEKMKKKILSIILVMMLLLTVLTSCSLMEKLRSAIWSSDFKGLAFSLKDDGTYLVEIGDAKRSSDIVIPSTHKGVPVTEVGKFNDTGAVNNTLKSVIISEGITRISDKAFYNCASLMSVTIPASVTTIGEMAFEGCNAPLYTKEQGAIYVGDRRNAYAALVGVDNENPGDLAISDKTTVIANGAFRGCTSLTGVIFPNGVAEIHKGMFTGCTNLKNITLPNSVISIGEAAFSGCTSLTEITIPDSVISIGDFAFENCTRLSDVTIGESVTTIGKCAFSGCNILRSATFLKCENWRIVSSPASTNGITVSMEILSQPSRAALLLYTVYSVYYWHRAE